jgi:hypothetical protein
LLNIHEVLRKSLWVLCRFGAAAYVPALSLEKPLYVRERNDGLYRPITYLLAKLFDELFITVFASLIFACAVWFLVRVRLCTLYVCVCANKSNLEKHSTATAESHSDLIALRVWWKIRRNT